MFRLALLLVVLTGCPVSPSGGPCARHSDCATGYCSRTGTCDTAPIDAGTSDGADADTTIPPFDGDPTVDAPPDSVDAAPEDAP
jgi:hypothetical protein